MAFNSKDASGATVPVTSITNTDSSHKQVFVLGRPDSDNPVAITNGGINVHLARRVSSGSTVTRVAGTTTESQLLAANGNRTSAQIHNDSTATLYLLCGAGTASATFKTVALAQGDVYELPGETPYTGVIRGVWTAANGGADVTEFTL